MEDQDSKKPFIIPKTHVSNKDVLISEKPDSRNVIELFNDIKSCALEAHFDFRQNGCKSCDTIRNQKLQKLYNEKRIKMKKDQDPIERLAFHLITYRDVASTVANDGLHCEQLSFPIEKYLGNPKDGVHLSRRPDILLISSGAQGLYRFGLLVCKVLLGKGYATIPSTNNNQLPAQLHYDHHFCKIQAINKEQRHLDDLLANSLIFCYEHENFETISHPPQILPIAILWYDLIEKFPPELISTLNQESQHRNIKIINGGKSTKKKTSNSSTRKNGFPLVKKPIAANPVVQEGPIQEAITTEITQNSNTIESPTTKYPSHFMVPYHRVYSNPSILPSLNPEQQISPTQKIISSRDPRLLRTKRETALISSETIPLSPQQLLTERSLSDGSSSIKSLKTLANEPLLITKSSSLIYIPLNPSTSLLDPRVKTLKQTRNIFYLELQAVKHALQQQKRLNHYYDSKTGLPPKTSYTLVPFLIRQVSKDEYEHLLNDDNNTYKFTKHSSNGIDYSSLYVSVIDCFNFSLIKSNNQDYIDLEQNENKLAFEQIEISNELIQREKQLNSQQIRLRLREKRQRKMQQQINEKKNIKSTIMSPSLSNSKLHISTGRQLLKEHQISTVSPNTHISSDLLDFFSREYKNENRPHVKHLLAELVGVFIEKYHLEDNQIVQNREENHHLAEEPIVDDQTMNSVIDMDIDSPSPQELCDRDERFRIPTPPLPPLPPPLALPPLPPLNEPIYTQTIPSLILTHSLSNEANKIFDDRCHKLVEELREQYRQKEITSSNSFLIMKTEANIPTEEAVFQACLGQFESSSSSSSSENSLIDNNHSLVIDDNLQQEENRILPLIQDDSIRSRDEFVKLLTKEAYVSKSSSPAKKQDDQKYSYDYSKHRRRSFDGNDNEKKNPSSSSNRSNAHQNYSRPSNKKTRRTRSPRKKLSSNRTVLISNRSKISNDNQNDLQVDPKIKRVKVDPLPPSPNIIDKLETIDETNQQDLGLKSIVTVPIVINEHDYRRDLNEKRRVGTSNNSTTDNSKTSSSRSPSRSQSNDHHRQQRQLSTNSHSSPIKNPKTISESKDKSKKYSRPSSSKDYQHRRQQNQNRDNRRHERTRSSDLTNRHHKKYSNQLSDRHEIYHDTPFQNSLPSIYHQRDINDLSLSSNLHHQQQRQPVRHKRFNYNHQSVADHPRFSNPNVIPSPIPLMDFNYPEPSTHRHSASPVPIGDRGINSSYYQNKYIDQSELTTKNYSNSIDSKPSNTIERLQMILQNKTSEPFEPSQVDYSVNETVKYSSSSTNHNNSHRSYSSKTKSDTTVQNNNQTFTYNDNEKLLTMVQRMRN